MSPWHPIVRGMPIKCKFGDLDRLRNAGAGGKTSPFAKLAEDTSLTIVDKFRISRLIKAIEEQLAIYVKSVVALASKYGDPVQTITGQDSFQIRPENKEKYMAEKAMLDAEECELAANLLPPSAYAISAITANDLAVMEPFIMPVLGEDADPPKT